MAMKDRIRYFKTRTRGSVVHHLWSPGPHLRAAGWTEQRLDADETKAKAEAIAWNQKVDAWRAATGGVELPGDLCAPGTIKELVRDYKKSDEYKELSPKTRRGYAWDLDTIVQWAGSERAASITPKMVKTFYRSFVTANKRGRGNHVIGMVRGLYKWAISEDRVDVNPAHKDAITLKGTGAVPVIWTPEALAHMVRTAEAMGRASIADALIFNAWFGLRVDDLLGMKKSVYRDGAFIVATSKTGAVVNLPVDMVAELSARMTQISARHVAWPSSPTTLIADEETQRPYSLSHFQHIFADVRLMAETGEFWADSARTIRASAWPRLMDASRRPLDPMPMVYQEHLGTPVKLSALAFRHTRQFAVTNILSAGGTPTEARSISGHTEAGINHIIDVYGLRTRGLSNHAFQKRLDAEAAQ